MHTLTPEIYLQDVALDPSTNTAKPAPLMSEYLAMATKRLQAITEQVGRGETVDKESHDWMLAQVDFLTDVFGNETLEFEDDVRSNVLQLVLAIANLNEQIRHQSTSNSAPSA
jgi:hypothetical protein